MPTREKLARENIHLLPTQAGCAVHDQNDAKILADQGGRNPKRDLKLGTASPTISLIDRVLPARRFKELGGAAGEEIAIIEPVDTQPRQLVRSELKKESN